MEATTPEGPDPDLEAQMILLAASQHNLETLRTLLRTGSANVQDPETGYTPLHAAIAACAPEDGTSAANGEAHTNGYLSGYLNGEATNGDVEAVEGDEGMEIVKKTLKLLLQNGAIWNDLDKKNETPGCIAWRSGLKELYEIMVDAGVRAEMLLNRLDGYEPLVDDGDEEDEEEEREVEDTGTTDGEAQRHTGGIVPEILPAEEARTAPIEDETKADVNSADYLQSDLTYLDDRLLDEDKNGVMMAWETGIMKRTADLLLPHEDLRVLNIGHGMGIIDNFFQSRSPTSHHIVEAHPTVLADMKRNGWYDKSGVTIHEGKWQDVLPKLIEEGTMFNAIYFDTFAEEYKALRDFFNEYVIGLLDEGGKWGFFNGLGADRQVCYDVYTKVVEMDLFEAGFDTEWETLDVPDLEKNEEWKGVRRRYWTLEKYKLPICWRASPEPEEHGRNGIMRRGVPVSVKGTNGGVFTLVSLVVVVRIAYTEEGVLMSATYYRIQSTHALNLFSCTGKKEMILRFRNNLFGEMPFVPLLLDLALASTS